MSKLPALHALAIALVLAACGRHDPAAAQVLALDPPEAIPLAWRDANTLIVGYRGSIHRYDVSARRLGPRLADSYDDKSFQGPHCFSPRGGRFALYPPVVTSKNGVTITSAPKQQRYRFVPEWSRPDEFEEDAEQVTMWEINPLDCSRFDQDERARQIDAVERNKRSVYSPRPLLLAGDGNALATRSRGGGGDILHLFKKGVDTPRDLALPRATQTSSSASLAVRSFQDSDGSYVIYETTSDFDAKRSVWPLSAWRLSRDLATVQPLVLPPGPWVTPHGFFKQLSCFSCGCSCYATFDVTGAHGRIYAHVHGKSVGDAAGIYERTEANGTVTWVRRVGGNFSGVALVSPDACRVVYSNPNQRLQLAVTAGCS